MEILDGVKRSILGNMILRQTMGGTRKEDKIKDRKELIERIGNEYIRQNSKMTHKLDLTMLDVSLVEDMFGLFCHYFALQSIDVSNWDTHNVRDMYGMFCGCRSLESVDVSKWDVSNVKNMEGMFYECSSLESINVSNWDVSNMESKFYMFKGCKFNYKKEGNRLIRI